MRIVSFMPLGSFWTERLERLKAEFPGVEFVLGPEAASAAIEGADAMLASRVDLSVYERAKVLKAVFVPITGLNHLPAELMIERGIKAYNVHGNAESVAQCALALALSFYGRIVEYHNDLRVRKWHGFWVGKGAEDEWSSIFRRPCAIFGTGAIGTVLARLLKAFECPVVGYRRHAGAPIPPNFDRIETDLAKAVASAELLFVALPLTPSTTGLFSKELLLAAKGKFIVNVGRGPVLDEEGLYLALRDGVLKGAGIDTWYAYPQAGALEGLPSRFPINELPNVVMTPHIAGSTREGTFMGADQTIENITQWLRTGSCSREANLKEMY